MNPDFEDANLAPHIVDLAKRGRDRWMEIIGKEKAAAENLMAAAMLELKGTPAFLAPIFAWLYRLTGGLYVEELSVWAEEMKLSFGAFIAINCGYELDHARHMLFGFKNGHKARTSGCTNGVCWIEGKGMMHLRTLDWPIAALAPATRIFSFVDDGRELFKSVGFPGQVGVLSGLVPGNYSVTIDWAPPSELVNFHLAPSFLLRETLATCRTFDEAVARLANTPLATSVFYTVCGTARGQACVIERRKNEHGIRWMEDRLLVQSNHYAPKKTVRIGGNGFENPDLRNANLEKYRDEGDFVAGSTFERYEAMLQAMQAVAGTAATVEQLWASIDPLPITSHETVHRMIFFPESGELHLQRRVAGFEDPSSSASHR